MGQPSAPLHEHRALYWVLFLLIVFLGIAAFFVANYQFSREYATVETLPTPIVKRQPLKVLIDTGDSQRAFQGAAQKDMTVGQMLYEIASVGKFDLQIKNGGIQKLEGKTSTAKGAHWVVYVNGEIVPDALARPVAAGDRITLRYEGSG
ncbi:MAG: hypothetical protein HYT40_03430 [Candidatus Sungbacteria bacterium]|uniref:DUF4430 domain-containing protein n=1 Tax=Candidatus Sungiibacteriota bacterium TaxID=2750080 RepID=A0A931SC23_9BACT|nr:hypothetical protein [Candidatus Sungbacteria bacterium]